jgi:NAD(P)-dependent dehydrogenase (short-subunit alcohol dehydrogenase family)
MSSFKNKTVIITGGTSGMGEAIGKHLAGLGAQVVINGRDGEKGKKVEQEIHKAGGSSLFVQGDVSDFDVNKKLVSAAVDHYGRLDCIICSAGVLGVGSVTDITRETWDYTIAANMSAVFYLCNLGIPEMQKTGKGSILVISSIAAFKYFPNHPAYCASKAGVTSFIKQLALDYGPEIRANLICPGQVDTPLLWESTKAFDNPEEIVRETAERLPLKRIGKPMDIAQAAAFLVSDEAEWITGSHLVVDGGSLLL